MNKDLFERLPIPDQMRLAADAIERARAERFANREGKPWPVSDFVADDLRKLADKWEAEDFAREGQVEDLQVVIQSVMQGYGHSFYRRIAKGILDAGWIKPS